MTAELAHIVKEGLAHYRVLRPVWIFRRLCRLCGENHAYGALTHRHNLPAGAESVEPFYIFFLRNQVGLLVNADNDAVATARNGVFLHKILLTNRPRSIHQCVNKPFGAVGAAHNAAALNITHPDIGFVRVGNNGKQLFG